MRILGIETSCDETAIAIVETEGDLGSLSFKVLSSIIHSQTKLHEKYGGVYPNLAKREHIKNLPIVLEKVLKKAKIKSENLKEKIDAIAVTVGPGLEPALWTGITFAKELGEKHKIPIIPTNHMEGHIVSVLLDRHIIKFPALALLISGGHTELIFLKNWRRKEIIGQTQDDAVGEAFDKVARMLGLPYPGGPEISKLAEEARKENTELEIKFPRPMIHSGDYNFSFSGLKTAVLYYLKKIQPHLTLPKREGLGVRPNLKKKIAREFEDAVTEVLVTKSIKAISEYHPETFIIGGGVIANNHIRQTFENYLRKEDNSPTLLIPEKSLTGDNAVMIAIAGYITFLTKENLGLKAQGNLKIK